MHGCHPFTAALSLSVMAGTSFTHVFPLPASAKAYLAHVALSLPAWCRPCTNDAAVFQRPARLNVARVVHVSVEHRARRVRRSRFHHQQMGVVFQLPVTDLQSPDELEKSLQQSCIINQRLKAIGSTGWAALQKWNGC
jgi:hypothetical protein